MTIAVKKQAVQDLLHEARLQLMDDASEAALRRTRLGIRWLNLLGLLTDDEAELWSLRLNHCPGHEHDPCRSWCAYCGNITPEQAQQQTEGER